MRPGTGRDARHPMARGKTLEFARVYEHTADPEVRGRIRELARAIARGSKVDAA